MSLDNEIAILHEIKRDGRSWIAEGKIDGETMRVTLWNEHRRAIDKAGYKVTWDKPAPVIQGQGITVALVEDNGRRRIAAALIVGTDDDWIEIKQK